METPVNFISANSHSNGRLIFHYINVDSILMYSSIDGSEREALLNDYMNKMNKAFHDDDVEFCRIEFINGREPLIVVSDHDDLWREIADSRK